MDTTPFCWRLGNVPTDLIATSIHDHYQIIQYGQAIPFNCLCSSLPICILYMLQLDILLCESASSQKETLTTVLYRGYSYYLESTLKCIFIFKRLCETRAGGQRDTGGRILHTPLDRNLHCLVYRVLLAGPYHCSICYYRRDIPKEPLAGRNSHAKGLTILIRRGQSRSKEGRKEGRNPSVTCLRKRECCWKAAKQSDGADTVNAGHAWRPVSFKVLVPHNGC